MSNEASQWSKPGAPEKAGSKLDFLFDQLNVEEEGLFARDYEGQLVRLVESTAADYDTKVALRIDGKRVVVKKAVPLKDAQGNVVTDKEGRTIPRSTTIYDAAAQLFCKKPGDVNPIPTLCHREHMQPVGACRVCVVELFRTVDGKRRGAGTLVPACHHRVEEDMEVQTIESPNDPEARERVRSAVRMLTELLAADHLHGGASVGKDAPNELAELAQRLGVASSRFAKRQTPRGQDNSSVRIAVNHDSCILCDRC
ncbi:MAG: (2Fe-2S)-binding protein, partial [Planctomycetales bacterium]|nr:(2Fe-2S)-binding protein [Planctomycetales bacterium]